MFLYVMTTTLPRIMCSRTWRCLVSQRISCSSFFEEDFRFYKADAEAVIASRQRFIPPTMSSGASSSQEGGGVHSELVAICDTRATQAGSGELGRDAAEQVTEFYYVSPMRAASNDVSQETSELLDLVALCNSAARDGHGNCVWLGWNAANGREHKAQRPERIANGSQLIAAAAKDARFLCANWPSVLSFA
jgi:hypothetical protein